VEEAEAEVAVVTDEEEAASVDVETKEFMESDEVLELDGLGEEEEWRAVEEENARTPWMRRLLEKGVRGDDAAILFSMPGATVGNLPYRMLLVDFVCMNRMTDWAVAGWMRAAEPAAALFAIAAKAGVRHRDAWARRESMMMADGVMQLDGRRVCNAVGSPLVNTQAWTDRQCE